MNPYFGFISVSLLFLLKTKTRQIRPVREEVDIELLNQCLSMTPLQSQCFGGRNTLLNVGENESTMPSDSANLTSLQDPYNCK